MDEPKEECCVCLDELNHETQALIKPKCGHKYHGKCLLQLTRRPRENKCAYCRQKTVSWETYKMDRLGAFKWTKEPHKEIKITLKLVGMKRNENCLLCKNKLKGCADNVECNSCYQLVHKTCADLSTDAYSDVAENFKCERCVTMNFETRFCFMCYETDTLNKIQCAMCDIWCHRDCYPTTMIFVRDSFWLCNWCIFHFTPILKGRGFEEAMERLQLDNSITTWAKKRCDPLLPEKFIKDVVEYIKDAMERREGMFEAGERLLEIFAESFNLNTRKLRNREVLVPRKKIVRSKERQPTHSRLLDRMGLPLRRFFYVTDNQVNKLILEWVDW